MVGSVEPQVNPSRIFVRTNHERLLRLGSAVVDGLDVFAVAMDVDVEMFCLAHTIFVLVASVVMAERVGGVRTQLPSKFTDGVERLLPTCWVAVR